MIVRFSLRGVVGYVYSKRRNEQCVEIRFCFKAGLLAAKTLETMQKRCQLESLSFRRSGKNGNIVESMRNNHLSLRDFFLNFAQARLIAIAAILV